MNPQILSSPDLSAVNDCILRFKYSSTPAIFTSTNRLLSLCPSTSIRRFLSPRCNVPIAKLCF